MVSASRWLDSMRLEVGSLGWNIIPHGHIKTACFHFNAMIIFV